MDEIEVFGVDETDPNIVVEVHITRIVDEADRPDCHEILRCTSVLFMEE